MRQHVDSILVEPLKIWVTKQFQTLNVSYISQQQFGTVDTENRTKFRDLDTRLEAAIELTNGLEKRITKTFLSMPEFLKL
jgi:hypothetical protein